MDRMRCFMSRLGLLLAGLLLSATATAQTVSPGAAVNVIASQPIVQVGDLVTYTVQMTNTSQDSGGTPTSMEFSGPFDIFMACTDSTCSVELPGTVSFIPGPNGGCDARAAGDMTCVANGANHIDVTIPTPIAFAPSEAAKFIVSFTVSADTPVGPLPVDADDQYATRANAPGDSVEACEEGGSPCATAGAQGSTLVNFPFSCDVQLDKCARVDTDDDGTFDDEICFGADEKGGPAALGLLGLKNIEWVVRVHNPNDTGTLGDCTVDDTIFGVLDSGFDLGPNAERIWTNGSDNGIPTILCEEPTYFNEATITCNTCDGVADTNSDADTAEVECPECAVEVDKQISCDGGNTFVDVIGSDDDAVDSNTAGCTGWTRFDVDGDGQVDNVDEVQYRYVVTNIGQVDVNGCSLTETNPFAPVPSSPAGTLFPGQLGVGAPITTALTECSNDLESNEPDSAMFGCACLPTVEGTPINVEVTDFGECSAADEDSATLDCQEPGLLFSKVCEEQDASGNNAVTFEVENDGETALLNCHITDTLADGTDIPISPNDFDLAISEVRTDPTGTVSGIEADIDNNATITCDIDGAFDVAGNPKTITRQATDPCEAGGEGCLTRTPGYWKNHPIETSYFLGVAGPLTSCGFDLSTHFQVAQDMCVSGREAKDNDTNMTQLQLVRQCAAANLNFAASRTELLGGDCESEVQGIGSTIEVCCEQICAGGVEQGDTAATRCINALDTFNNLDESELDDFDLCPNDDIRPDAPPCNGDTDNCHEAGHNELLNQPRNYGPANGGGPGPSATTSNGKKKK